MEEVWRPVVGYEGLYEVSNLGRVKSIERDVVVRRPDGTTYNLHVRNKILKQGRRQDGYADVSLSKQGVTTLHCVHRLIAEAWIPNPDGLNRVNHIDLDKTNNSLNNLEWVSNSENMRHAAMNYSSSQAIPIYCSDTDTVYPGMTLCDRALGLPEGTTHNVIRHNKPCKYSLRIATEEQIRSSKAGLNSIPGWAFEYTKKGRLHEVRKIKCITTQIVYDTLSAASQDTGISPDTIRDSIRQKRSTKGYTFYYLDDAPEDEAEYAKQCEERYHELVYSAHKKGERLRYDVKVIPSASQGI